MKAAVLTQLNAPLELWDVEACPLGAREARVRIDASGVCHTDLHRTTGAYPIELPHLLGHEASGTVLEVGPQVARMRPGDRVVASWVPVCGACWSCLNGQSNICEAADELRAQTGVLAPDGRRLPVMTGLGTFREEMNVDERLLVRVETDLPAEQLALLGCAVTTGVGAVLNTARLAPGATGAVIGCGGVGLAAVQGCRIAGASKILAVDPVAARRELALELGATVAIDPADDDPVLQIRAATGGRGVDYAFEMVGKPATILQAREATRIGGTTVLAGASAKDELVSFSAWDLHVEGRILGCQYGSAQVRRDIPRLIDLVEVGQLEIGSLVTERIGLEQIDDAFARMRAGTGIRSVIV